MNGTSITCPFHLSVFPNTQFAVFYNKQFSLQKANHYPCRSAIHVTHRLHRKVSPPKHYNHRLRRISITSRDSDTRTGTLVKKISTDIMIDGCCIASNFAFNYVSASSCVSIFVTCVLNNIFLNLSVNGCRNFWKRSLYLFKLGLITNTIGSLIYVQPFNVFLYIRYVISLSLGMGILSNLRYSTLRNIEEKIKLSMIQCVIFRVLNNIIGTAQQMTILQYFVVV